MFDEDANIAAHPTERPIKGLALKYLAPLNDESEGHQAGRTVGEQLVSKLVEESEERSFCQFSRSVG